MSFTKTLDNDLKVSLLTEDPFLYAHLVKFENVPDDPSGRIGEKASDYSYISDASFDIKFNDGSKSLAGDANGEQTYIANRLAKVGTISETTEAKVSNVNLIISSIALSSQFAGSATNTVTISNSSSSGCSIQIAGVASWTDLGFSEGDKITIYSVDSNNGKSVTISGFTSNNNTATCIYPSATTDNVSAVTNYNIILETNEVAAILNDPASASYNGYINREVTIYKAHIDPDTGVIIGAPYTLFKGIISKAKLTDDPTKNSTLTWSLTSHWGDFVRVTGRITSDSEHRALGGDGSPDLGALHRDDYGTDLGFMHGEQAINIMSIYQVKETRYKLKKSGFIFKKYKQVSYEVEVDREVDLRINLEAKYLPVIYGVQRTDSIPIFADSLQNDPTKIYVAYAICEGEVSGLYDIYVDDQSRICIDKNDSDTRSTQTDEKTIDVICEGRMDKGDTLSSAPSISGEARVIREAILNIESNEITGNTAGWLNSGYFSENATPEYSAVNSSAGVIHGSQTHLQYPISSRLIFHAGKSHQRSDDTLTRIATAGISSVANGFKLQTDAEKSEEYWTENHRLLDTAYVVAEYEIADGDVTIPSLDFVVRGREIEQYDYDYSYTEHPNPTLSSGTIANKRALFKTGDFVDFYSLETGNASLATNLQIVDSTVYYNASNVAEYKFRFSADPLALIPATTQFYMVSNGTAKTSDSRYPMVAWDYKSHSGTVSKTLTQTITTTAGDGNATRANNSTGAGIDIDEIDADLLAALKTAYANTAFLRGTQTEDEFIANVMRAYHSPASVTTNNKLVDVAGTQSADPAKLLILNAVKLATNASTQNDYYKGQTITIVNTDATTGVQKRQSRKIVSYVGGTGSGSKIAYVGEFSDSAPTSSAVTGSFVAADDSNGTFIRFNNVSAFLVDDFIFSTSDGLASIPSGTRVISKRTVAPIGVYVSNPVKLTKGATLAVSRASGTQSVDAVDATDFQFLPKQGDTYEISSKGNKKVSINPAVQLLDYLTNTRYGRGLEIGKDINLDTFKSSARLCDTRSDITLILPNSGTYTTNDRWHSTNTISSVSYFQWQGTIKSTRAAGSGFTEVTFTDCIGKIAHKWFDWKSYEVGNVIYHKVGGVNKIYLKTGSSGSVAAPTTGNASSLSITKVGTSTSVALHGIAAGGTAESLSGEKDNPVVKAWNGLSYEKSGYILYDSDDVKYWRYMGWQEQNQREVTRHQTNALIRTDTPLFDNVNSMLKHFNGILRYSNGLYELEVESTAPVITATAHIPTSASYTGSAGASDTTTNYPDPRFITEGDIIGAITVDDSGLKGIANTVSVSIADPNIRYDTRSVSFFKSEYLKEDRNIPKKKDIKTPLITNYFNARINAEQYLDQSRFSRKINFVIGPRGVLLLAGNIITLSYPRFGWVNKQFRVSNLSYREDCSVQVTAQEHNDDTYIITAKEKAYQTAGPINGPGDEIPAPKAPSGLETVGGNNAIAINWKNTINSGIEGSSTAGWSTEIYYNNHATFTNVTADTVFSGGAILLHSSEGRESYLHTIPNITDNTTYYYWVRHIKLFRKPNGAAIKKPSLFHPLSSADGIEGTALPTGSGSGVIYLYKSSPGSVTEQEASPISHPSTDASFPTLAVALIGANAGKVTGVATLPVTSTANSGSYKIVSIGTTDFTAIGAASNTIGLVFTANSSAPGTGTGVVSTGSSALTNNEVIGTDDTGTGWYTVPIEATIPTDPADPSEVVWIVAATANSAGTSDDILREEWTNPVRFSGTNGLNTAGVDLYQLGNLESAPADPSGTLVYTFATGVLATNNLNGWSQTPESPTITNKYLWKISAAALSNEDTHTIPIADWSAAIRSVTLPSDGKGLSLILTSRIISYDNSTGTPVLSPSGATQDIAVSVNKQNITGTPTYSILTSANGAQTDLLFSGDGGDGVITAATATIDASTWDTVTLGKSVHIKATLTDDGVTYTDTESVHAIFSGVKGATGEDGAGIEYIFAVTADSSTSPSTPSNDWGFDNPTESTGWYDGAPATSPTNKALWRAQRDIKGQPTGADAVSPARPNGVLGDWTGPVVVGHFGDDAVTGYLTNENFTAPLNSSNVPILTGGTGNMKIFEGVTDTTSSWSFAGGGTVAGMTCTVNTANGSYALSGTWTGTTASFNIAAAKSGYSAVTKTFSVSRGAADGAVSTTPGPDGADSPRVVLGYVYYTSTSATTTNAVQTLLTQLGTPTYTFSAAGTDSAFSSITNFSHSPPTASDTRNKVFYAPYTAVETVTAGTATGSGTATFGSVAEGISFAGLVTFQALAADLNSGGTSNITQIDGGKINTDSITADRLTIGKTGQNAATPSRLLLLDDSVKIFDGGNLRVHLGNLTNSTT